MPSSPICCDGSIRSIRSEPLESQKRLSLSSRFTRGTAVRNRHVANILWGLILLTCASLGALKARQNFLYRRAERLYQAERLLMKEEATQDTEKMRELLHSALSSSTSPVGWSKEKLEQELPGNPTLASNATGARQAATQATWVHPRSGGEWVFDFNADGELTGYAGRGGGLRRLPQPSRETFSDSGEQLRRAIADYGRCIWYFASVLWLLIARSRAFISELLLALGIVVSSADFVSPGYPPNAAISNDILAFDAMLLGASCAAVAFTSPQVSTILKRWIFRRRFSIAWLFGVTTAAAVLIMLGRSSLLLGLVAITAVVSYAIFTKLPLRKTPSNTP